MKPSKVEGNLVETEKKFAGGDRLEVDPKKHSKRKKHTVTYDDSQETPVKAHIRHDLPPDSDKGNPDGRQVMVEESSKRGKRKERHSSKDKAIDDTPVNADQPETKPRRLSKHRKPIGTARVQAEMDQPSMDSIGLEKKSGEVEKSSKAKERSKDSTEPSNSISYNSTVPSSMATDRSVLSSCLTLDVNKQQPEEGTVHTNARGTNSSRRSNKDQSGADTGRQKFSGSGQNTYKSSEELAAASIPKPKKRKVSIINEDAGVQLSALGPSADIASVKKKQRKSTSSASDAVGSLLGSSIDNARKKAKFMANSAGESAQAPIMSDVVGVVEGAVEPNLETQRSAASRTQGSAKSEGDGRGLGDTELLRGFESSGDDQDGEDFRYQEGEAVPAIVEAKSRKVQPFQKSASVGPGYVYVGRIPHGFYEHQMRAYFGQFGNISRLRLSRNKATGHSKHFGFIEFESEEVAKIVAQTMDNYLLFGHILKVKLVPREQLHPDTFKGANKRFKQIPWAQIEGRKLATPVGRDRWEKRVEAAAKKRKLKAEQMKEIGYEFDSPLKGVDQVPVQEEKRAVEPTPLDKEQTLITSKGEKGSVTLLSKTTKKTTKAKSTAKEDSGKGAEMPVVREGESMAGTSLGAVQGVMGKSIEPVVKKAKKAKMSQKGVSDRAAKRVKRTEAKVKAQASAAQPDAAVASLT